MEQQPLSYLAFTEIYAITIDKIANTTESSSQCFRPLEPTLNTGLDIIWKKHQVFSPVAELFLEKITERFQQ